MNSHIQKKLYERALTIDDFQLPQVSHFENRTGIVEDSDQITVRFDVC